jgi:N-acetylmuramoyl-L-alanine amidase
MTYYFICKKSILKIFNLLFFLSILLNIHVVYAVTALDANITHIQEKTVFYLRLSHKPENIHKFFLPNPKRMVIDVHNLNWQINKKITSKGLIKQIRFGNNQNVGRIVLDLTQDIISDQLELMPHPTLKNLFLLKITLQKNPITNNSSDSLTPRNFNPKPLPLQEKQKRFYSKHRFQSIKPRSPNEIIITIDAGHGGNDPGATSVSGYKEKNIVLAFSKEFANAINRERNMRAILTRDKDFFIPLAERPLIAKHYQSDLFISIHADALDDKTFNGSTIYTLSDTASDTISAKIAESENKSDIIAGVNFQDQLPEVTDILIDFMRRETDIASYEFAENLVLKLKNATKLVPKPHRKAGFLVLKSPNIPSVLIEIGYLTSIDDERRLTNPEKRRKMIQSMINAIKTWHYQRRLAGH